MTGDDVDCLDVAVAADSPLPTLPLATARALLRPAGDGTVGDGAPGDVKRLREEGRWAITYLLRERHGTVFAVVAGDLAARWSRRPRITVAASGAPVPGVVGAAVPNGVMLEARFGVDGRRRACMLVDQGRGGSGNVVVKATRPGTDAGRAPAEQRVLHRLDALGVRHVPSPRGRGRYEDIEWSVETALAGIPFAHARRPWRAVHGRGALDRLAAWLGDLAVATAHRGDRSPGVEPTLDGLVGGLRGVPCTMSHGDLGAGENTLVRGREVAVVDWETATPDGLPLDDLVPALALGMARLRGWTDPCEQGAYAARLCADELPDSPWFHGHVAGHLGRLGIGPDRAGALATVAWVRAASLRARREALDGGPAAAPRLSAAEHVLDAWWSARALGPAWPAFAPGRSGRP